MLFNKDNYKELPEGAMYLISNQLYFEDYLKGQDQIDFWMPEGFDPEADHEWPMAPKDIADEEDKKMKTLIESLTLKVFDVYDAIEVDEKGDVFVLGDNKILLGNISDEEESAAVEK